MKPATPTVITSTGETHFIRAVAEYILMEHYDPSDPVKLSRLRVLLPNKRAILMVKQALLTSHGRGGLLLPYCYGLGELQPLDWLPASYVPPRVISANMRLAWAVELVQSHAGVLLEQAVCQHDIRGMESALYYAKSLLALRDDCHYAQLPTAALRAVVPEDYAQHWEQLLTLFFDLNQLLDKRLDQHGLVESISAHHHFTQHLDAHWHDNPPDYPVLVAGSTASTSTTAHMMRAIAKLPHGQLFLPGLDMVMEEVEWQRIGRTHPQFFMKQLLDSMGVGRTDIVVQHSCMQRRDAFVSRIMAPAVEALPANAHADMLTHIAWHGCVDDMDEAEMIALRVHDALQCENVSSIAIISEKDAFIRRLSALLASRDIMVNRAAGVHVSHHEAYHFIILTSRILFQPYHSPTLLAWLRHPYVLAQHQSAMRALAIFLDEDMLRGCHHYDDVLHVLADASAHDGLAEITHILQQIVVDSRALGVNQSLFAPFSSAVTQQLRQLAEHILADEEHVLHGMLSHIDAFGTQGAAAVRCDAYEYPDIVAQLLQAKRLPIIAPDDAVVTIMGPMEARFHLADMVIIPHMNEGLWPVSPQSEPWLNFAMRTQLGLPTHERLCALAAHDVSMMLKAPRVLLSYTGKHGDTLMQPSRFIERLLLASTHHDDHQRMLQQRWNMMLHAWRAAQLPSALSVKVPAPYVDMPQRVTTLSATACERLIGNPFAFYTSAICGLRERDALDQPFGPRELGTLMHDILDDIASYYIADKLDVYIAEFHMRMTRAIAEHVPLAQRRFYAHKIRNIADSLVHAEQSRINDITALLTEETYSAVITTPKGDVKLGAKIDRLERRHDGSIIIADYKSGAAPTVADMLSGARCQLIVAALLVQHNVPHQTVAALEYWMLHGDGAAIIIDVAQKTKMDDSGLLAMQQSLLQLLEHYCFSPDAHYSWNTQEVTRATMIEQFARVSEW